jgi:flavin prenyltransferase
MSDSGLQRGQGRIVVGISGASGVYYGVRLLQLLRTTDVEIHLVMSRAAQVTLGYETDLKVADVNALAHVVYGPQDIAAAISSGSFPTRGMIVAPCSIRSLAEIATCVTTSLLTRAADVMLKERRRLVLMVRETPLHLGHLRAMVSATEAGAIICPPVPAFYAKPASIEQMVDHTLGRVLDLFGIDIGAVRRWKEADAPPAPEA